MNRRPLRLESVQQTFLEVSAEFKALFAAFLDHFVQESKPLQDATLAQEEKILDSLIHAMDIPASVYFATGATTFAHAAIDNYYGKEYLTPAFYGLYIKLLRFSGDEVKKINPNADLAMHAMVANRALLTIDDVMFLLQFQLEEKEHSDANMAEYRTKNTSLPFLDIHYTLCHTEWTQAKIHLRLETE